MDKERYLSNNTFSVQGVPSLVAKSNDTVIFSNINFLLHTNQGTGCYKKLLISRSVNGKHLGRVILQQ